MQETILQELVSLKITYFTGQFFVESEGNPKKKFQPKIEAEILVRFLGDS